MRRLLLLVAFALMFVGVTGTASARGGSDSSGAHSYTSTCEGPLPRFTNTSDPTSTGNGVIEFRTAGATLTLSPGESGVLDAGEVSPNTPWDVVFFDLGQPYVFDGGTFRICAPTAPTTVSLAYSVSVAEGCSDGEPVVNFTNTGTGTIYASIDIFAQHVDAGSTVTASWPLALGDPDPQSEWHAYEFSDPMGDIGAEFATGTVFLPNACGDTTGPVDSPTAVIRNIAAASSPSQTPATESAQSAGRIMFERAPGGEVVGEVETDVYTVAADGSESDVELLFAGGGAGRWSPDGSEVSVFCCDDGMVAHLLDVVTRDVRGVQTPDPTLELHCDFGWSPDSERLVCEGYGLDDPSRNGIYSVRASDGGGLTRITANPQGGDIPGAFSPDGTHLVFKRFEGEVPTGMFVVDIADDGAGVGEPRQVTAEGMTLDDTGHAGRWSPDGEEILFVARESEDHHKAVWMVNADGGSPEQLPIAPGCGGRLGEPDSYGCYSPGWSPDGDQIVFTRSEPDGSNESIWIVDADGSGLVQVTTGADDNAVWGTPPTAT
jgi:Tol biopolymer transport system component